MKPAEERGTTFTRTVGPEPPSPTINQAQPCARAGLSLPDPPACDRVRILSPPQALRHRRKAGNLLVASRNGTLEQDPQAG